MSIFENFKSSVQKIREKIEEFKDDHKSLSQAISTALEFLPGPYDKFARTIWDGIEKEDDSAEKMLLILERIQRNDEKSFMEITKNISELIKKNATKEDLQKIGEQIRTSNESIVKILEPKLNELLKITQENSLDIKEIKSILLAREIRENNGFSRPAHVFLTNVDSATRIRIERSQPEKHDYRIFKDVKDFWKAYDSLELDGGMWIEIDGTFSEYGPLTFGTPWQKKEDHFNWRGSISSLELPFGIDGIISISSGNAIIRLEPVRLSTSDGPELSYNRYAGLYQGIGRNSIPLVIDEKLLRESRKRHNVQEGKHTYKVRIRGTVEQPPGCFSTMTTNPEQFDKSQYVLHVAGEGSSIEYLGNTDFLEADVWAIFESKGLETMIVRCPDFSEETSIGQAIQEIRKQARRQFGSEYVLKEQFDSIKRPFGPDVGKYSGLNIEDARSIVQMARQIFELIR